MIAAIEWNVTTVVQIITIGLVVVGWLGVFYSLRERVSVLEQEVFKDMLERLGKVEQKQRDLIEAYAPIISELKTKLDAISHRGQR